MAHIASKNGELLGSRTAEKGLISTLLGANFAMEYNPTENPNAMLPPGTVHLVAEQSDKIILVPKPSADPDDPLNWSKKRKWLNVTLLLFYVFTTGIGGTSVYSVFTPISNDTGISIAQLNNGTGYLFLMAGWTNIIWQPLALTFGRRPIILMSLLFCVAISEWTAWIDHYPSWAAARCLYGLACAPVEVLPQICIPDVFFAHERGAFIGWYMFVLCASNFIAPLIAGFMNDTYGWHWVQHWAALILALNFVLAFFLYEESMYTRASVEGENVNQLPDVDDTPAIQQFDVTAGYYKKKTFLQRMKLWSYNGNSFSHIVRIAYRPILIFFLFPNIMWAGFMYGFALAWYVHSFTVLLQRRTSLTYMPGTMCTMRLLHRSSRRRLMISLLLLSASLTLPH